MLHFGDFGDFASSRQNKKIRGRNSRFCSVTKKMKNCEIQVVIALTLFRFLRAVWCEGHGDVIAVSTCAYAFVHAGWVAKWLATAVATWQQLWQQWRG
jgi:hypothetical protein